MKCEPVMTTSTYLASGDQGVDSNVTRLIMEEIKKEAGG